MIKAIFNLLLSTFVLARVNAFISSPRALTFRTRPLAGGPTLTGQPWRLDLSLRVPVADTFLIKRLTLLVRFEEEPGFEPPQGCLVPILSEDATTEVLLTRLITRALEY
jgi:hypothetical protein